MNGQNTKRIAYYIVALVSFFFFAWAGSDILSAGINLATLRPGLAQTSSPAGDNGSPEEMAPSGPAYNEIYHQMVADRMVDGGARLAVSGIIFFLARKRIRELREV